MNNICFRWKVSVLFQRNPSKAGYFDSVPLADNRLFRAVSHKVIGRLIDAFFLEVRMSGKPLEEALIRRICVDYRLFYRFGVYFLYPDFVGIFRKILMIQSYGEVISTHVLLTFLIPLIRFRKKQVIDKSASPDCLEQSNALFRRRLNLRFQAF